MTPKEIKKLESIDLLIKDLNIIHPDIRAEAKEKDCEKELVDWKNEVIQFLMIHRGKI